MTGSSPVRATSPGAIPHRDEFVLPDERRIFLLSWNPDISLLVVEVNGVAWLSSRYVIDPVILNKVTLDTMLFEGEYVIFTQN